MPSALYPALFFTVAMLVNTGYFLLGGLPLLILRHDEPLDARFVRGFFNVYYHAAFWVALGAAASYAAWGRWAFAVGATALAATALALRLRLLPMMLRLGEQIMAGQAGAVRQFRRIHATALLLNLVQLVVAVCGLIVLSRDLSN